MDGWRLQRIAWIDVESTGLEPDVDLLLEIALVVTTANLHEIARESVVIAHTKAELDAVIDREDRDPELNEFIRSMHTANGLLAECQGLDGGCPVDTQEADWRMHQILMRDSEDKGARFPLGGCSTWLARSLVRLHLPQLYERIHSRTVDASGYKTALVNWAGFEPRRAGPVGHRALPDTLSAIKLARTMKLYLQRAARLVAAESELVAAK